ncbi:MAG TPA: LysM peptidoglycan-binding domain-containing protein, partial [Rhizomicrobium sp.]|nr:LysM peptidoglycan-binding domain-containing protein [Rhizomicrobium sp.]
RDRFGGDARERLERALPQDLFAKAHPVTDSQHAEVEHILNPSTTLVQAPVPQPATAGAQPPPPTVTVQDAPKMTDIGPGNDFEKKMLKALDANVGAIAAKFRTLRAQPGQPSFPIASANPIADAAQEETENYFRPYIRVASRKPTDTYHPGAYSLETKLGDESTRPQTDGDRRGWIEYWMTLNKCDSPPCSQSILDQKHYSGGRAADDAEFARVRELYLSTRLTDVDDAIHSWPAEAGTGTVFIQPYQTSTAELRRQKRWDVFTILIHEMMHILAHPNFAAAADRIGGTGRKVLTEGMAEVMRTELWSGPGHLRAQIATSEKAPLRQKVEGAVYPYDEAAVVDHGYYGELAQAQAIDAKVGHENAKAAFFLGHVELLGIGAGTRHKADISGVAFYDPSDTKDAQVIVAAAGDTYAGLLARTGASAGGLLDDPTGKPLAAGAALAPGTRVRVPGIRWVRAIDGDTLGDVARQNNVPIASLATANGFAAGAPPTTPLPAGKRILIPIQRDPS